MSRITTIQQAGFEVVRRLREHGYDALFTGGYVRDMLLGIEAKDVDVATNATPDQVCNLFPNTRKVGAAFGVILVRQGRFWIETATFRTDLSYKDGRRPEAVIFSTPQEDAQRRDFTINGLFYDPIEQRVIDYVDGEADIRANVIRAIGEPERRFGEDHLRLLRAVRFATRFGFTIEPATATAIRTHAPDLTRISAERIRGELDKMLSRPNRARSVELITDLGLLPYLWLNAEADLTTVAAAPRGGRDRAPAAKNDHDTALAPSPSDKAGGRRSEPSTIRRLESLPDDADFVLSMATLLLGLPVERVREVGKALRCSNEQVGGMMWLVASEPLLWRVGELALAQFKRLLGRHRWPDLLAIHAARLASENAVNDTLEAAIRRAESIPEDEIAPPPFIIGDDLLQLGLQPGPRYKQILETLYDAQLNNELQDRPTALARLKTLSMDAE